MIIKKFEKKNPYRGSCKSGHGSSSYMDLKKKIYIRKMGFYTTELKQKIRAKKRKIYSHNMVTYQSKARLYMVRRCVSHDERNKGINN